MEDKQMHMICYMSKYVGSEDILTILKSITDSSKKKNRKRNITGVLFFRDGQFLQIIEGEEADLRLLMREIEADTRHKDIEYLIDTEVEHRGFQEWTMDHFMLNEGQSFDLDTMQKLTTNFQKNILPRANSLIYFYKSLLSQPIY